MNFHRGYDQFIFVRGQEFDRYASPATTRDIDLDQYLAPDELGTHRETLMRQYLANIADKRAEEDHFAPRVFREAMKFVEQNHDSGKFLLVVDSFDPHEPWDPPKYYTDLYDPDYEGQGAYLAVLRQFREILRTRASTHTRPVRRRGDDGRQMAGTFRG